MGRRLLSYLVVEILSAVHLPLLTLETVVFQKPFQRKYSQLPFKKYHKKKKNQLIYILGSTRIFFLMIIFQEKFRLATRKLSAKVFLDPTIIYYIYHIDFHATNSFFLLKCLLSKMLID